MIFIDWIGAGLSSRPDNFSKKFSPEKAMDYFVRYIEEWRRQMQIDKFILLGHSFGAYISSYYALAHKDRIVKLILLSVPGVP